MIGFEDGPDPDGLQYAVFFFMHSDVILLAMVVVSNEVKQAVQRVEQQLQSDRVSQAFGFSTGLIRASIDFTL